jgi:ribosomal protein RSM22 (predicted rRNA methylase)
MLPATARAALDAALDSVSRRDLAARSVRISEAYRAARSSATVIRDRLDALAYGVVRMPATYAAVEAALARLAERWPEFAPASVLDLGAGPGTATLAARETWPSLVAATLVEPNAALRGLGEALLGAAGLAAVWSAGELRGEPSGRASPASSVVAQQPRAELAIMAYVLVELPAPEVARAVLAAFDAAGDALVLVEPGTPAGFDRVLVAREALIAAGARIVAPCPGNGACPMAGGDWCHFSVRLARSRDHKQVKGADAPFEDERFSYLVATRRGAVAPAKARLLAQPDAGRGDVALKLCTPAGLMQRHVARRDRDAYKAGRKLAWGDAV